MMLLPVVSFVSARHARPCSLVNVVTPRPATWGMIILQHASRSISSGVIKRHRQQRRKITLSWGAIYVELRRGDSREQKNGCRRVSKTNIHELVRRPNRVTSQIEDGNERMISWDCENGYVRTVESVCIGSKESWYMEHARLQPTTIKKIGTWLC